MGGEFKLLLPESPGPMCNIQFIVPKHTEGFLLGDTEGKMYAYDVSADPRCPYQLVRTMPGEVDRDEKWHEYLASRD